MQCPECKAEGLHHWYADPELKEKGAYTMRCDNCGMEFHIPAETTARTRIAALRKIVKEHSATRVEGYVVDAFTASMLVKVYDALSAANKEKFGKIALPKLVDLGWKVVK